MKKTKPITIAACCVAVIFFAASSTAMAVEALKGGSEYTSSKCYCGEELGAKAEPTILKEKGREIRVCGEACKARFQADPEAALKKIDEQMISEQKPHYPLDTCVVTGEALGENPVNTVYQNRLVRFCTADALEKFNENPEPFIAALDKAVVEKQSKDYPVETCPVMGGKVDETSTSYVAGDRVIRFCCPGCVDEFKKDPAKFIKVLDEAEAKKPE